MSPQPAGRLEAGGIEASSITAVSEGDIPLRWPVLQHSKQLAKHLLGSECHL